MQIWLVSEERFVIKLSEVPYLASYYNTVGKKNQNSLESLFNSPGWEIKGTQCIQKGWRLKIIPRRLEYKQANWFLNLTVKFVLEILGVHI